jgi:predicted RNA-binding Zn ribbon-like protein
VVTSAPLLGEPLPVELMNTIWMDRRRLRDASTEPGGLVDWLPALGPRVAGLDLLAATEVADLARRLLPLRGALRALAAEATADTRWPRPDAAELDRAVAGLNAAAAPRSPQLTWVAGGSPARRTRVRAQGAAAVLSTFAEEAIELFGADGPTKLRACYAPNCVLYFVKDHARREWCTPLCGNRVRAARHYRRHRDTVRDPAPADVPVHDGTPAPAGAKT